MFCCGWDPYGDGFDEGKEGLSLGQLEDNPHGIDLGALEPRIPDLLATPSARIELAAEPIFSELDRMDAPPGGEPRPTVSCSLVAGICARTIRGCTTWRAWWQVGIGAPCRCIPTDAARRSLEAGGVAEISSRVGSVRASVEINDDLMPGVVSLPHGWGHGQPESRLAVAAAHEGVNSNRLTDGLPLDPLSGNAVLNGIPVEVAAPRGEYRPPSLGSANQPRLFVTLRPLDGPKCRAFFFNSPTPTGTPLTESPSRGILKTET